MPFAIAAAAIGGALISADAAGSAADAQSGAARASAKTQLEMFNTINEQQRPYRQAGYNALGQLQYLTGTSTLAPPPTAPNRSAYEYSSGGEVTPGGWYVDNNTGTMMRDYTAAADTHWFDQAAWDAANSKYTEELSKYHPDKGLSSDDPNSLLHKFGAGDLNANLAPNWQFALDQGQGATRNANNASGGMLSGNTLKGIQDYTIGKSGDLYQQAMSNYTSNQANIFNRLSSIAGLGQTANQTVASAGVPIAGAIGNAQMAAGQAQASGYVGQANAISGGINNAGSWYAYNNQPGGTTRYESSSTDPMSYIQ